MFPLPSWQIQSLRRRQVRCLETSRPTSHLTCSSRFAGVYPYEGSLQRYLVHPAKWLYKYVRVVTAGERVVRGTNGKRVAHPVVRQAPRQHILFRSGPFGAFERRTPRRRNRWSRVRSASARVRCWPYRSDSTGRCAGICKRVPMPLSHSSCPSPMQLLPPRCASLRYWRARVER